MLSCYENPVNLEAGYVSIQDEKYLECVLIGTSRNTLTKPTTEQVSASDEVIFLSRRNGSKVPVSGLHIQ